MSLIERIETELKAARLAREKDRRDALSLILNSLREAQKELQRPLSEEEELQVLQRERKRRVEAAEAFRSGGRDDRADAEEHELEVLEDDKAWLEEAPRHPVFRLLPPEEPAHDRRAGSARS